MRQIITIDSRNRLSGSISDFTYKLNIKKGQSFNKCVLLSASIPKSIYTFKEGTNIFTVSEGATNTIITIPNGIYTRKSLAATTAALLSANCLYDYTITYSTSATAVDTGLYTYTVSNNSGVQPVFTFSKECPPLGFDISTNTFSANTLTSTRILNLASLTNVILIKSDIMVSTVDNVFGVVLASDVPSQSYINYINTIPESTYMMFNNVEGQDVYRFRITDEIDDEINTYGNNVFFEILLFN